MVSVFGESVVITAVIYIIKPEKMNFDLILQHGLQIP
jgi:hypothetical protein